MALKREATSSMFEQLKNAGNEDQPKTDAPVKKETAPKKEASKAKKESSARKNAPVKEEADKEIKATAEEKNVEIKEPIQKEIHAEPETKAPVKAFDFGQAKERELKKIRKQFVLTPTHAKWLKETAELNNISENKVIENMINMMMNG